MITGQDKLQFEAIFGIPIEQFKGLLSAVIPFEQAGIDIIKFDKWINPPDGVSCSQAVRERYGADAVGLIERIL